MANIRDLKKDVNFVLGDIIEAVYIWEAGSNNKDSEEGSVIIDKAIAVFDELMSKIHSKNVDNAKAHFKTIRVQLEEKATELVEELNKLGS
ncbi:hypothetical protein FVB32_17140 [Flagellimonas hymeniacidonis]|uniref:Uncharacterized protein n=1 Tax=Flagellimonas hymeniacidonis TaxID=2603628 RepID=A0A5C8UYR8_9FLAO|nr:hypothetical protein [Flagellimonas hymeniacidonis]TXN34251.1 hypothetical protein FVB32_17140 [Flagellimonas hymeniacidonis]